MPRIGVCHVCLWVSTNPGTTIVPEASTTSASDTPRSQPTAAILPSSTRTSPPAIPPISGSSESTKPPRMTIRSLIRTPCPLQLNERRRFCHLARPHARASLTQAVRPHYRAGVADGAVVIVGGTSGIGLRLAERYAERGAGVVVTGRDVERAAATAAGIGGQACCFDLAAPSDIAAALAAIGPVRRLVLAAIERDENSVRDYDVGRALRLVTLKLVGYTEVVHALADRLVDD